MAKDNIALLNDIAASLRKMNQANIRDQLQQREFRDRQEAIAMGQPQAEDQGPAFIDAAEDFRRRVKGSITATKLGESVTESGKRAKRSNKEAAGNKKMKEEAESRGEKFLKTDEKSELHLSNIYKLLVEWKADFATGARNAARDTAENKLESFAPGMHPNSMATRIKKGWNKGEDEAMKRKFKTKSIPGLILAAALTAVTMSISDIIRGFKMDGLDGAISSWLGGSEEGSLGNAIRQSFVLGAQGAAVGLMIGGPVGALVGGIIGMAIGAFTGWIGAGKINDWMDEAGKNITDGWNEMKGNFLGLARNISNWIYTPGTKAMSGNHPAVKTSILGGFIDWNPGDFSISGAWDSAKESFLNLANSIKLWIWNEEDKTLLGGSLEMPEWMFDVKQDAQAAWYAVKDFGLMIKNAVISMLPDTFTDYMKWTVNGKIPGADLYVPGNNNTDTGKFEESSVGGTASLYRNAFTGEVQKTVVLNDGKIIAKDDFVDLLKRNEPERFEYDGALKGISSIGSMVTGSFDEPLPLSVYNPNKKETPVVIPVNSDSSTTTVNTIINVDKKDTLGSGNNNNAIMGEDGFIYSW